MLVLKYLRKYVTAKIYRLCQINGKICGFTTIYSYNLGFLLSYKHSYYKINIYYYHKHHFIIEVRYKHKTYRVEPYDLLMHKNYGLYRSIRDAS